MSRTTSGERITPRRARWARVRRGYHFGSPALVYIGVTLFVALGAFNSQNNLLFWTFGLSLGVLTVSGVISGAMLMGVHVTREHIGDAAAGEPLVVRYRVRNSNRLWPAFALYIEESGFDPERDARERTRRPLLWFLRPARTPAPPRTLIEAPSAFVVHVGAGEAVTVESRRPANRRGRVDLQGVRVHSGFPFGLVRKSVTFEQPGEVLVRPRPLHAERAQTSPRAGSGGDNAARRAGRGDEFFALREFTQGDTLRLVAWRASARRGKLVVRDFAASSPARLAIDLDLAPGPSAADDNERSISIVAGLSHAAARANVPIALSVPALGIRVPLGTGAAHHHRVLDELAALDLTRVRPDDARAGDFDADEALDTRGGALVRVRQGRLEGPGADDWIIVNTPDTSPTDLPAAPIADTAESAA